MYGTTTKYLPNNTNDAEQIRNIVCLGISIPIINN